MASAGVQSSIDVNTSMPVISTSGALSRPSTWSWIWFGVSVLTIAGFHVRVFGHPLPPSAQFP